MGRLDWLGRRWLAWPITAAWVAASMWRFTVASAQDQVPFGSVAQREHMGLLLLQGAAALTVAGGWSTFVVSLRAGERRLATLALATAMAVALVFGAIFLRPGLLDWGVYEN